MFQNNMFEIILYWFIYIINCIEYMYVECEKRIYLFLRRLDGEEINQFIYLKFKDMIC